MSFQFNANNPDHLDEMYEILKKILCFHAELRITPNSSKTSDEFPCRTVLRKGFAPARNKKLSSPPEFLFDSQRASTFGKSQ